MPWAEENVKTKEKENVKEYKKHEEKQSTTIVMTKTGPRRLRGDSEEIQRRCKTYNGVAVATHKKKLTY